MVIDTHGQAVFSNALHWVTEDEVAATSPQFGVEAALAIVARSFTRISQSLVEFWGKVEFDVYMEKLLIDERGGRAGFPLEVADALLRLSRIHAQRYGFGSPDDIWVNPDLRSKRD